MDARPPGPTFSARRATGTDGRSGRGRWSPGDRWARVPRLRPGCSPRASGRGPTRVSASAYRTVTGTVIVRGSTPHDFTYARSSSTQPCTPGSRASRSISRSVRVIISLDILDVPSGHPGEPVESLGIPRREGRFDQDPGHAVGEERGARQSMRSAAGAAGDRKPVPTQLVGQHRDIGRAVRHRPSGHSG
jgi:hypothetical protein